MPDHTTRPPLPRLYRWGLAAFGAACVLLGGIGVFVPGLPTTVFLIVASYCFARSCPWLEERLLRGKLFAPYMRFVDAREPMPRRARAAALVMMWGSVGASLALLLTTERVGVWGAVLIVGAAAAGTVAIVGAGRRRGGQVLQ